MRLLQWTSTHMASNHPADIAVDIAPAALPDDLSSEDDVLRLVCLHSKFDMAELWSFGNGSTGLDASVSFK